MSRTDYSAGARAALDRFETPVLSAGFADRVVAAALASGASLPPVAFARRRDRRGLWRRAGQAAIGIAAFGMMSAAAVASGLLGAVGIEVPVLSAMLAPAPAKKKLPEATPKPAVRLAERPAPPPPVAATVSPPTEIDAALPPWRQAMLARQAARRAANLAERQAFLAQHPGLAEAIAAGPEARRAYLAQHPEVKDAMRARIAEVRARRAAERAAMIMRQRARLDGALAEAPSLDPAARAAMQERRRMRLEATAAGQAGARVDPTVRAARIEAWRAYRAERRAERFARMRAAGEAAASEPNEGSPAPVR